jgi:hypothetical protein
MTDREKLRQPADDGTRIRTRVTREEAGHRFVQKWRCKPHRMPRLVHHACEGCGKRPYELYQDGCGVWTLHPCNGRSVG